MGDKQMPDNAVIRFRMWRNMRRVDHGHDDAFIGNPGGIAAVASHNAGDGGSYFFGILDGVHQIGGDIFFKAAPAYGKDEQGIFGAQMRTLEVFCKDGFKALVIGAGRQFGNIIRGAIGLKGAELAKIIGRMRCRPRATPPRRAETAFPRCFLPPQA